MAVGRTNDHTVGTQALLVVGECFDPNRRRTQEAMAASYVGSRDSAVRKFQRLAIEQADNPSDRADKTCTGQTGPGHRLRPVKVMQNPRKSVGQNEFGRA